jgi:tol-pal system protein YbgF
MEVTVIRYKKSQVKEKWSSAVIFSLTILSLFVLTSCVTTPGTISSLEREINSLKYDVAQLKETTQEEKAETGATYYTLLEEVRNLRGTYEEKEYEFNTTTEEVAILKEVLNRTTADMENRLYAIENRLAAIEAAVGITPPPSTGSPAAPPTGDETPSGIHSTGGAAITDMGDEALYKSAFRKFQENDLDNAITEFTTFIELYPNSSLADNAQFWIGECYYSQKDYERAILEYDKVIKNYPDTDKVPSALLKEGYAFAELGDTESARSILTELIRKYPTESQADLAKKKLEKL